VTTTEVEVRAFFSPFGSLKEVVLLLEKDGRSKRSAFVKFFSKQTADKAIAGLHDRVRDGNETNNLVVRFARPKMDHGQLNSEPPASPNISFAPSLPTFISPGPPAGGAVRAPPYLPVGAPMGVMNMGPPPLSSGYVPPSGGGGGYGPIREHMSRGGPGCNLYINNLDHFVTDADIRNLFSPFGNVISVKLFANNGYGFVSFDNPSAANAAITALNGLPSQKGTKRLEVSLKTEKGEKKTRGNPY